MRRPRRARVGFPQQPSPGDGRPGRAHHGGQSSETRCAGGFTNGNRVDKMERNRGELGEVIGQGRVPSAVAVGAASRVSMARTGSWSLMSETGGVEGGEERDAAPRPFDVCNKNTGVKVFVRIRTTDNFASDMIECCPDNERIKIHTKPDRRKEVVNNQHSDWLFRVDGILHDVPQDVVYDAVSKKAVSSTINGFSSTIMCYGQTGAGKTYTMTGAMEQYEYRGIIPRAIQQIFKEVEEQADLALTVYISYLEIYNETLFDLLSTMPDSSTSDAHMTIVEDSHGVRIKGLSIHLVTTEEDALNYLFEGETNRIIASHTMNRSSSRSHCIFTIHVETRWKEASEVKYLTSKLNMVDLAGSERLGKTGSEGQVMREAMYINKSLSFLEQTIIALADSKREHIPFRQSKLTHALKDSIGGTCNTILVANIYGETAQIEETLSTLRFASRMKRILAEPVANVHSDPIKLIHKLKNDIQVLQDELAMYNILGNRQQVSYETLTANQIRDIKTQVCRYLDGTIDEINITSVRQLRASFAQFKIILQQQKQEIETALRKKYILIDKTNKETNYISDTVGIKMSEESQVGELSGEGFGIGLAPTAAKAKKIKSKKNKESTGSTKKELASIAGKDPEMILQVKEPIPDVSPKQTAPREQEASSADSALSESVAKLEEARSSTPPQKSEMFEMFKAEKGREINRILIENKNILNEKRKNMRELTEQINNIKEEIDITNRSLNIKKQERQDQGEYINEQDEPIVDEDEFNLIIQLKDLKRQYQHDFDVLRDLRVEVQYCQKLVDQCRLRLLTEFDIWYNESFLISDDVQLAPQLDSIRPGLVPYLRMISLEEDDKEKFQRIQHEILMENPDSVSFYKARMKLEQRHNYIKAIAQPQPITIKKKPGMITSAIKNKPPSNLQCH
ncbi:kinesin-like protein KIF9 isoform X1 [Narcine bancroftii]|uniref:kinesin-like protein KIF9 isoform X1 n=1 Tax=Narcine bancroftii TaxID=1343680 RepID=UPI00383107BA